MSNIICPAGHVTLHNVTSTLFLPILNMLRNTDRILPVADGRRSMYHALVWLLLRALSLGSLTMCYGHSTHATNPKICNPYGMLYTKRISTMSYSPPCSTCTCMYYEHSIYMQYVYSVCMYYGHSICTTAFLNCSSDHVLS